MRRRIGRAPAFPRFHIKILATNLESTVIVRYIVARGNFSCIRDVLQPCFGGQTYFYIEYMNIEYLNTGRFCGIKLLVR